MGQINGLGTCEVSDEGAAETARSYSEHVHREVKRAFATRSHPVRSVTRAEFSQISALLQSNFQRRTAWAGSTAHCRRKKPLISLLTSRCAPLVVQPWFTWCRRSAPAEASAETWH